MSHGLLEVGQGKGEHCLRVRELFRIHCSRERPLDSSLFSTNFVLSVEFSAFSYIKCQGYTLPLTCVLSQQAFLLSYLTCIKTITIKYAIFVLKGCKWEKKDRGTFYKVLKNSFNARPSYQVGLTELNPCPHYKVPYLYLPVLPESAFDHVTLFSSARSVYFGLGCATLHFSRNKTPGHEYLFIWL